LLTEIRARVPEFPAAKRARFITRYQVSPYDASVLANDLDLAAYFEKAANSSRKPKQLG
jgi:aspartyl-tRNA(Asn)/glutamyl-tRNA(Gln) amidotransferase subunit B